MIAQTPKPPYYAVIFTSIRTTIDDNYDKMAEKMELLVQHQSGFLGMETARNEVGITVSYWESLEAIKKWKAHSEHEIVQKKGKSSWYKQFSVKICKVEQAYDFKI